MGGGGGVWVLDLRQVNTCSKVPLQLIFLDDIFTPPIPRNREVERRPSAFRATAAPFKMP